MDAGTTTAVYFATIHKDSSVLLADICSKMGQRAFVGKVNMDRNSPDNYWLDIIKSLSNVDVNENSFVSVKLRKIHLRIPWRLLNQ